MLTELWFASESYLVFMIVSRVTRRYYIKLESDPCTSTDTGVQAAHISRANKFMGPSAVSSKYINM
jgi:hypothetical protein